MPKFKKNPNPIMKKQAYGTAKSPFAMKYKSSAFPFKSPLKQGDQHFDVTGDGVTPADIETPEERALRGHSTRGSVADILARRKEEEEKKK